MLCTFCFIPHSNSIKPSDTSKQTSGAEIPDESTRHLPSRYDLKLKLAEKHLLIPLRALQQEARCCVARIFFTSRTHDHLLQWVLVGVTTTVSGYITDFHREGCTMDFESKCQSSALQ